jgi:hypothetical protein
MGEFRWGWEPNDKLILNLISEKNKSHISICSYVPIMTLNQLTYYRIERYGSSGNTPDLYSRVAVFEYRPGHRLSWLRLVALFPAPPVKCLDSASNEVSTAS